ncbi:hypothetical protein EXU85_17185 [Spirosoma sp. KCTC 42546]|uniref:hypothetical protein n=1 Tax=Spirosoma sp. KCTC 42546 TaxID=2520506 RepID=UPI001156D0E7|nr:hypothetical protein [Spirosoma sp. KCTC 42546]QDK80243.1 hypothetical protein EXU85_17185 [Spirosoma sp. KCTC 42546]
MRRSSATFQLRSLFSTDGKRFWTMQLIYLIVSCLFLLLFLNLPNNRDWLITTIQRFYDQRRDLGIRTDIQTRKQEGYGAAFTYTNLIRKYCKPSDYFLIPPQRYLIRKAYRQGAATGYAWVYPSVLYYHLGKSVHLVDMVSPDSMIGRATFTFWVQKNQVALLRLTDNNRAQILAEFRKYDPHFFAYTPQQAKAYVKTTKP